MHNIIYLLEVGFNRCPYQLLRSYKRHEENMRKIGQERIILKTLTQNSYNFVCSMLQINVYTQLTKIFDVKFT